MNHEPLFPTNKSVIYVAMEPLLDESDSLGRFFDFSASHAKPFRRNKC